MEDFMIVCSKKKIYAHCSSFILWIADDLVKLSFLSTSICFFFPIFFRTLHHLSCFKNVPFSCRYDYYSFSVIPAVGELVAGDRDSYQYLVESIRRFPPQVIILSYVLLQILPQFCQSILEAKKLSPHYSVMPL